MCALRVAEAQFDDFRGGPPQRGGLCHRWTFAGYGTATPYGRCTLRSDSGDAAISPVSDAEPTLISASPLPRLVLAVPSDRDFPRPSQPTPDSPKGRPGFVPRSLHDSTIRRNGFRPAPRMQILSAMEPDGRSSPGSPGRVASTVMLSGLLLHRRLPQVAFGAVRGRKFLNAYHACAIPRQYDFAPQTYAAGFHPTAPDERGASVRTPLESSHAQTPYRARRRRTASTGSPAANRRREAGSGISSTPPRMTRPST